MTLSILISLLLFFSFRKKFIHTQKVYLYLLSSFLLSQNQNQIRELKSQFDRAQLNSTAPVETQNVNQNTAPQTNLPETTILTPYQNQISISEYPAKDNEKFFGYDFFTKRDTIPFWENLPAPKDYILGPGDEIIIFLWGETQIRSTYVISRDGNIYDEKVGLMFISGKNISESKLFLKNQFERVYSTLGKKTPTTYMDVSLGKLRSINVNFVGQVKFAGIHPIHPFSTVITGLIQAGGVDTTGSLRKITIKRNENDTSTVDLYDYFIKGNLSSNIQLRDQDIVIVPPRVSTVKIDSAVLNQGVYEILPGENVYDLIEYAGGLTHKSSSKISIKRIKSRKIDYGQIYEGFHIDYDNSSLINVENGDIITVRYLFLQENEVEIIGQVKSPGKYLFKQGMTLSDLLVLSSGFNDTTFWKSVYTNKAEIIRRTPYKSYDQVIDVNLNEVMNGRENHELNSLDKIVVHANSKYKDKENIQIIGEVNIPGSYPLTFDKENLSSLIERAGGLTTKALPNGISIFRKKNYFEIFRGSEQNVAIEDLNLSQSMVRVAWENDNIILMPGDSVVIKERPGAVNITGEIYNPGLIEFEPNKSIGYYIQSAGGITNNGDHSDIVVIQPNGVVTPKKWYKRTKIQDGSTIIIKEKPEQLPFNSAEFASTWVSIISSTITTIVLARQLQN